MNAGRTLQERKIPGQKDAQVSVIEGQTGSVMLGAGVMSDSGVIGQLIFEQRNFDIKDWPESFGEFIKGQAFKGAGQDLRIVLQPGTEVSEYSISFTEPYFRDKPISLNVVGLSRMWKRECYDENRLRAYVGFEKRYKNRWHRSIGFRFENVNVDSVDSGAPKEITDVKGGNLLAGIKLGFGRDLTDDRFNPSKGYRFDAGYEQMGGGHTFGILSGTYRWYRTLYKDLAERSNCVCVLSSVCLFHSCVAFISLLRCVYFTLTLRCFHLCVAFALFLCCVYSTHCQRIVDTIVGVTGNFAVFSS